jgi:hypothetical protein
MATKPNKPKLSPIPRATPGPKPDMLKIDGPWKDAIKKSLQKKKPPEGWPK